MQYNNGTSTKSPMNVLWTGYTSTQLRADIGLPAIMRNLPIFNINLDGGSIFNARGVDTTIADVNLNTLSPSFLTFQLNGNTGHVYCVIEVTSGISTQELYWLSLNGGAIISFDAEL